MYTENTSDAWHIPRYPTRNHGIPSMYCIVLYCVYNLLNGFLFYMGIYFYESGRILQAFKRHDKQFFLSN